MNDIPKTNYFTTGQSKNRRLFVYALVLIAGVIAWTVEFRLSSGLEPDSDSMDDRETTSNAVSTLDTASNRLSSVVSSVDSDKLEPIGPPSEHPFDNPTIKRARQYGALASVVIEAVDEDGTPVADADVEVFFYVLDRQPNKRTGKTDSNGHFTACANATWDVRGFVRKEGFHEGMGIHYLQENLSAKSVAKGRWQPWNPTIRILMLRKGKSADFVRKSEWRIELPETEKPFGYDFDVGDFVVPHGKGVHPHIFFSLSRAGVDSGENEGLNISFPGTGSGLVASRRNHGSSAELPRRAPDGGYCQSTNLFHHPPGPNRWRQINDDNNERVFVFRTQETDPTTGINRTRHGIMNITGFHYSSRKISFWYGINKMPDDSNLEGFGW